MMEHSPNSSAAVPGAAGVDLWQRAASFAARAHLGQLRKDAITPYVAHPFRVSMVVCDVFGEHDAVCVAAALLHDTIEDTPVDYDDVYHNFGEEIADCVAALTKDMRLKDEQREAQYDNQLMNADWRARLVKLADTYDNICDRVTRPDNRSPKSGIDKAERAIRIAEPVADAYPSVARGIKLLRELVEHHQSHWDNETRLGG